MTQAKPVVLVPGFMGSRLAATATSSPVWVDLAWLPFRLGELLEDLDLARPTPTPLEPAGVLEDVPWGDVIHFGVYRPLREWALSSGGLGLGPADYVEFSYDWRRSLAIAADALDRTIASLPGFRNVTLLAHSQGGLVVSRLFAQGGPGAARVERVVAIGCPFAGLLKTIDMIEQGSGVLTLFFPTDPIRELLRGFPGTYELMPSRTAPLLFSDRLGNAATPFSKSVALPASRYDAGLLQEAAAVVAPLPTSLPVPVVLIEGFGERTACSGAETATGVAVTHDILGDGTCPSASLYSVTGTPSGGSPARRIYPVPFGEHVGLVRHPRVFDILRAELSPTPQPEVPQVLAAVKSRVALPGAANRLVVETRLPDGSPLPGDPPSAWFSSGGPVPLQPCPVAGSARWVGTFAHPLEPDRLVVRVPGAGPARQPHPILLGP